MFIWPCIFRQTLLLHHFADSAVILHHQPGPDRPVQSIVRLSESIREDVDWPDCPVDDGGHFDDGVGFDAEKCEQFSETGFLTKFAEKSKKKSFYKKYAICRHIHPV